jgi:type 1 glutamine amidotransferase
MGSGDIVPPPSCWSGAPSGDTTTSGGRRRHPRPSLLVAVALVLAVGGCGRPADAPAPAEPPAATAGTDRGGFAVLVFTRTTGFRHASIAAGVAAIRRLGAANGFAVDATEDPERVRDDVLARYRAVVFLSTTGEPLGPAQRAALERWVEGGGGWVGVHAAADAFYAWPWYGELVGARFRRHPSVQPATVRVTDRGHPSTASLPAAWARTDEWYDFRDNPGGRVQVLAVVDESTYRGGGMGADHPVSWYHRQGRGRSWYTALGHTEASWSEAPFLDHVLGGIRWAAGAA